MTTWPPTLCGQLRRETFENRRVRTTAVELPGDLIGIDLRHGVVAVTAVRRKNESSRNERSLRDVRCLTRLHVSTEAGRGRPGAIAHADIGASGRLAREPDSEQRNHAIQRADRRSKLGRASALRACDRAGLDYAARNVVIRHGQLGQADDRFHMTRPGRVVHQTELAWPYHPIGTAANYLVQRRTARGS
jgi:hypothetical protein